MDWDSAMGPKRDGDLLSLQFGLTRMAGVARFCRRSALGLVLARRLTAPQPTRVSCQPVNSEDRGLAEQTARPLETCCVHRMEIVTFHQPV